MAQLRVRVYVDVDYVGRGVGTGLTGGLNANDPAYGQGLTAGETAVAQTKRFQTSQQVPGTAGSVTLANILTALNNAANNIAGATGTPIIDATTLAEINGWQTGNP
jgi:hypothetical protein